MDASPVICAECGTPLAEGQERETTAEGTFCRACFERLRMEVQRAIESQGVDVPWARAALGGLAGAAAGILAWWGFTALTKVALGLVAVAIGFAVGKGITLGAAGKRSRGLQVLSVTIAAAAFVYASYLVTRTLLLRSFAEQGTSVSLPWLPDGALLFNVVKAGFGVMDVVFLGIVLWEAWRIPGPVRLRT